MFYIVEFLETQEVEVVPALWVEKEICQWPAQYRRDKLVKAIRSEEQPGHTWDAYCVRILYKAGMHITYYYLPIGFTSLKKNLMIFLYSNLQSCSSKTSSSGNTN